VVNGLARQTTATIAQAFLTILNPLATPATQPSIGHANILPTDAYDPAYPASISLLPIMNALFAIVGADGTGVQWEDVTPQANGKSGLGFINCALSYSLESTAWKDQGPSVSLKAALKSTTAVGVFRSS
jgi:hypothetical protein